MNLGETAYLVTERRDREHSIDGRSRSWLIGPDCALFRDPPKGVVELHGVNRICRSPQYSRVYYMDQLSHLKKSLLMLKTSSCEPVKLADMVILEDDFLNCVEDRIKDIEVKMTIVGGKVVYER